MSTEMSLLSVDPVAVGMTVEGLTHLCDEQLALAKRLADDVRALKDAPGESLTWGATLGKLDQLTQALSNAGSFPQLMSVAHPDEAVREAARACEPKIDAFITSLYLDADLAKVFTCFAQKGEALSVSQQRLLEHTLRDYRRNGLDLSSEKQQRLRELNEELTRCGQEFEANLASATLAIEVMPQQLEGLPPAYIANHVPNEQGNIRISTDYPDMVPFMSYAKDRVAARELFVLAENRAAEKNLPLLDRLITLRAEKAALLGYATWADYVLEVRMAKRPETVRAFLDDVHTDLHAKALEEFELFRQAFIRRGGSMTDILWQSDRRYLNELASQDQFSFDSQALSTYFEVSRVLQGILDIASELYGLEFQRIDASVWHEEVMVCNVMDRVQNTMLGRAYIDLYPRPDKYKHAAVFTLRHTMRLEDGERLLPLAALVCNFPKPGGAAPALLTHDEVVTFFHEFGHLLHDLLSQSELSSFSGTSVARDFVEAPSQMFEEWAWSRETLDRFAYHHATQAKIPDDLFHAMIKNRTFGEALDTERQLFLADLDLTYHTHAPGFDTTKIMEELHSKYSPFARVPDTHFQATFGHLVGYDAGYYGYQWALSIAKDLLTRFEREGLMNTMTAKDYREQVLAPGGGDDEENLVKNFLGRPSNNQAYKIFLGIR